MLSFAMIEDRNSHVRSFKIIDSLFYGVPISVNTIIQSIIFQIHIYTIDIVSTFFDKCFYAIHSFSVFSAVCFSVSSR